MYKLIRQYTFHHTSDILEILIFIVQFCYIKKSFLNFCSVRTFINATLQETPPLKSSNTLGVY